MDFLTALATLPRPPVDDAITPFQWGTLVLAALAFILGLVNLYRDWSKTRVKLEVTGARMNLAAVMMKAHNSEFELNYCVEVINLSQFAVTLARVGVTSRDGTEVRLFGQLTENNEKLPQRIESHSSITLYCQLIFDEAGGNRLESVYAVTQTGDRRTDKLS